MRGVNAETIMYRVGSSISLIRRFSSRKFATDISRRAADARSREVATVDLRFATGGGVTEDIRMPVVPNAGAQRRAERAARGPSAGMRCWAPTP